MNKFLLTLFFTIYTSMCFSIDIEPIRFQYKSYVYDYFKTNYVKLDKDLPTSCSVGNIRFEYANDILKIYEGETLKRIQYINKPFHFNFIYMKY